jgi:hypothetical protein
MLKIMEVKKGEFWTLPERLTSEIIAAFKGDRKTYLGQLKAFVETLEGSHKSVWEALKGGEWDDSTTLFRALNLSKEYGVHIKDGKTHYLDLLCLFAFNLEWTAIVKRKKIRKKEIQTRSHYVTSNSDKATTQNDVVSYDSEIITPNFFYQEQDENYIRSLTLNYYLRFNNNWISIKNAVANNIHVAPAEPFLVKNKMGMEERSFSYADMPLKATLGRPALYKILAIGGVGKSTLLWHLIKTYCSDYETIYFKRIDIKGLHGTFDRIKSKPARAVIIFVDDIVSYPENRDNLVKFAETIEQYSANYSITMFFSERLFRYDRHEYKREFERCFSEVFTIHYSNKLIRNGIFEQIYKSLYAHSPKYNDRRAQYLKVFNEAYSESIIDSAYSLIRQLRVDLPGEITYQFEWEDWEQSCKNSNFKYGLLADLYKVVAFFYQFGIQVPLDFCKGYYGNPNITGTIIQLVGSVTEDSPILIDPETRKLRLRNEKLAEWFFEFNSTGDEFFLEFIENVNSNATSYLFRNVIRKNSEFTKSRYKNLLPNQKILEIIEKYLALKSFDNYGDEERKMLMDKHFVLFNMGRNEESLIPLRQIILSDGNNIYALSRLAQCLEFVDPTSSEQFFKTLVEKKNAFATYALLKLYYENPKFGLFEAYQNSIFELAADKIVFSRGLINYLEYKFDNFPNSTCTHLYKFHRGNVLFRTHVSELLINKRKFSFAFAILSELAQDAVRLSFETRSRVARLLIDLYENQNTSNKGCIVLAENILKIDRDENSNNPYFDFLLAKVYHHTNQFKSAEKYFLKAFELDDKGLIFFSICRFYRYYAKALESKGRIPRSVRYLLKNISFIETTVDSWPLNINYKLELCGQLNELVGAYYRHSRNINDNIDKYANKIHAIEIKLEGLLRECLESISKMLPNQNSMFSHYQIDATLLNVFTKCSSISARFYFDKTKRISVINFDSIAQKGTYLTKSKNILLKSLYYDDDNPITLIYLLRINIALKSEDIFSLLSNVNFRNFNIKQKASFCRALVQSSYKEYGIRFIRRFGLLNSSSLFVKNDLAYCYIEANEWQSAVVILENLTNVNNNTLELIYRIIKKIPIQDQRTAEAAIELSKTYLQHSENNKSSVRVNVCRILFISARCFKSYDYYYRKIYNHRSLLPPDESFKQLVKRWIPELVDYVSINLTKLISEVGNLIYAGDSIEGFIKPVDSLLYCFFKSPLHFESIIYSKLNKDPLNENIRKTLIKAAALLIKFVDYKGRYSYYVITIIQKHRIIVFDKILLRKVIFSDFEDSSNFTIKLVRYYEKIYNNDPEISRLIGWYYLKKGKFSVAFAFFIKGRDATGDPIQRSYAYANLANCTVSKIEHEGNKSFDSYSLIQSKIREAEYNLYRALECNPEFPDEYRNPITLRIAKLKRTYKM